MIEITDDMIATARDKIANGTPEAVGFRLMFYAVESTRGLEDAEIEKFEALEKAGFITKTKDKALRESKGSHYGILLSKGDHAFEGETMGGGDVWGLKEGDLIILDRYAGVTIELPPGSGQQIRFTNDESVLGRIT